DAARRDHDVGDRERLLDRPPQALRPVPHRKYGRDLEADLEELVGDPARVGVDDAAGRQLVAGREDGDPRGHGRKRRRSRAAMPAYAPATRSSPTTETPPASRRSITLAGNGFTTSKKRKSTNATAVAAHVPGRKAPATTSPATSSITMFEWSWPPRMVSARPAAQIAAAASPATAAAYPAGDRVRSAASAGRSGTAASEPNVPEATGT